jgi:DNA-binding response OmpR family regulator
VSELAKSPRIFVVDDEEILASTLAEILHHQGYDAVFFTEPLKALAAAKQNGPDLLIADVMMPRMSGIDLATHMKTLGHQCPVLLFSGRAGAIDQVEDCRLTGHVFELLLKPVHPTEVIKKVELMLGKGHWAPASQPPPARASAPLSAGSYRDS